MPTIKIIERHYDIPGEEHPLRSFVVTFSKSEGEQVDGLDSKYSHEDEWTCNSFEHAMKHFYSWVVRSAKPIDIVVRELTI